MKKSLLFYVCIIISEQILAQAAPAISVFSCSVAGRSNTISFNTNLDNCYEMACAKLRDSHPVFENYVPGQHSSNGQPICWNPNSGGFQWLGSGMSSRCLVESGYEPASFNSSEGTHYCASPEDQATEDLGCAGEKAVGNPCNVGTGNKFQSETDFSNPGLSFTRSYNSQNLANLGLGAGWRHNFQRKLRIEGSTLTHISASGRGEPLVKVDGGWQGEPDSDIAIVETPSGFELTKASNVVETYNSFGQLLSITDTNAQVTTYNYNASYQLDTVTNQYGLSISFIYDEFNLSRVVDALGNEYRFEYYPNGNLESVIYSDLTTDDLTDNPRRIYHYENTQYPNHLTGITDENGDRYATWAYDVDGKAISTEHAQTTNTVGQEKFELDYQGSN